MVSVVAELAEGTGATVAVIAGGFEEELPDDVITVEIGEPGESEEDVRNQLIRAGAQAAVDYLNTSTAQG